MEMVTSFSELRNARARLQGTVGFVPTMGYLHAGHISLAKRARADCDCVAASIFVNPTQFAPTEDLAKYPRDLPRDLALLEEAGVDLVWTPTSEEMYPSGFQTWVEVTNLTQGLEGAVRPAHFKGVTTVVAKLFLAVQPDKAYFGQKDAQQAAVIRQMVKDLNFPLDLIVCPIVREPDGLALSSRNVYLDPDERKAAVILFKSLNAAKAAYDQGERSPSALRKIVSDKINSESLARLQYVSCADFDTLVELENLNGKALLSLAVYFGKTRLIDNFVLGD